MANHFNPRIVALCCENSAYLAAKMAGEKGVEYPEKVDLIKLPCAGRVDLLHLLKALERGADGVIVIACPPESCQSVRGNLRAGKRVEMAKKLLQEAGWEPERVAIGYVAANAGNRFVEAIRAFSARLLALGPKPGKVRK